MAFSSQSSSCSSLSRWQFKYYLCDRMKNFPGLRPARRVLALEQQHNEDGVPMMAQLKPSCGREREVERDLNNEIELQSRQFCHFRQNDC